MSDDSEVTVCAGPPTCMLENDEAVAHAQAGCPLCRRIAIRSDGSETEYRTPVN